MCRFLSALAFRDGSLFYAPEYTDSHADLLLARGIKDDGDSRLKPWCRVEFAPKDGLYDQPDAYQLTVDEEFTPGWFDEHREKFAAELRTVVDRMIVREDREIIMGGCWIISGGARVRKMVAGKVAAMRGGTLAEMWGGTLATMLGGTLAEMWGGTIAEMRGGTIAEIGPRAKILDDFRQPQPTA